MFLRFRVPVPIPRLFLIQVLAGSTPAREMLRVRRDSACLSTPNAYQAYSLRIGDAKPVRRE